MFTVLLFSRQFIEVHNARERFASPPHFLHSDTQIDVGSASTDTALRCVRPVTTLQSQDFRYVLFYVPLSTSSTTPGFLCGWEGLHCVDHWLLADGCQFNGKAG